MRTHRVVSPAIRIAGLLIALALGPGALAAEKEAFVVLPGAVPQHAGPQGQGREANLTELLATSAQTGGVLGLFRQTIAPQGGPPTHIHRDADEFCYVLSGTFDFKLGDRIVSVPAGSFIFIPKGTVHTFKNRGTEPGVLLFGVTPAGLEGKFAEWSHADAETVKALDKKYYTDVVGPPLK